MESSIRIRARHVVVTCAASIVVVAALLAFSTAQTSGNPVNAGVPLSAPANEPIPAYDGYKGWGQVTVSGGGPSHLRLAPVAAWYWTGRSWTATSRTASARVYIYPYASGWSWTWTQSTGWLAMRTSALTIGYRPIAIAT